LKDAWKSASKYDLHVMAEKWITGKEYTVSILAEKVLPMIRLETENRFYDYQAKYELDTTRYLVPCGLDSQLEMQFQQLAKRAFDATGCIGWGRVDMMVDEDGYPWLIEVNSVPGMTSHSLVPMAAKATGISFDQLVWEILEQTVESE
jgi:D-alanine-D-alanine ligase